MQWNWQVEAEPGSPDQNMAADAGLLAALAEDAHLVPTVRVYTWDRTAVSIGRLQREDPVRALYPDAVIVRRPTGGRAVVHGEDLTITAALSLKRLPPDCRSVLSSHQRLVDAVKNALELVGAETVYGGCPIASQKAVVNCFEMAASCDLVEGHTGEKRLGSAQRRVGNAVLQQMSLPLRFIPDFPSFLISLQAEYDKVFRIDY